MQPIIFFLATAALPFLARELLHLIQGYNNQAGKLPLVTVWRAVSVLRTRSGLLPHSGISHFSCFISRPLRSWNLSSAAEKCFSWGCLILCSKKNRIQQEADRT